MQTEIKDTQSAVEAVKQKAPKDQSLRVVKDDVKALDRIIRQGDLYLIGINPSGKTSIELGNGDVVEINADAYQSDGERQLAPGNTVGSRHIIPDDEAHKVKVMRNISENNPILGDVIHAKERFNLVHPEHADFSMPAGSYIVAYQTDWKTKRRVAD